MHISQRNQSAKYLLVCAITSHAFLTKCLVFSVVIVLCVEDAILTCEYEKFRLETPFAALVLGVAIHAILDRKSVVGSRLIVLDGKSRLQGVCTTEGPA